MKEFFSKLWVKITAICLAVFLFLLSILLLFNSFAPYNPKCYHVFGLSGLFGSFNKNGNPTNYYQTEKTTNIVELIHISAINREVYYVWVNVSDMEEDSTISLYNGPSSDTNSTLVLLSEYTLTGQDLQNDNDGWICIYDRTSTSGHLSTHFYLGVKSKMRIREVICSAENGNVMNYSIKGLTRRGNPTISGDSLYQNFDYDTLKNSTDYTLTFTKELQQRIISLANLNDEQSTFNKNAVR
jgi:hypothetical protein